MNAVRIFFMGGLTSYRALFSWKSPLSFATTLIVNPALQVVFFLVSTHGSEVSDPRDVLLGGALMASALPGIFGGAMAVGNERSFGTLANLLIAPVSRVLVFSGRCVPYIVNGVFSALVVFLSTAPFTGDFTLDALGRIGLAGLAGACACTALGLVVGAVGLLLRDIWLLANLMMLCLLVLSGAVVPLDTLPAFVQVLSAGTPLAHAIAYVRGGPASALGLELCVAAVLMVLAVVLLRHVDRAARSRATVEVV